MKRNLYSHPDPGRLPDSVVRRELWRDRVIIVLGSLAGAASFLLLLAGAEILADVVGK